MPSTFTSRIRLERQGDGENPNTWGLRLNQNVIDLVDEATAGFESIDISSPVNGEITLTANNGTSDQSRNLGLNFTGALAEDTTVIVPAQEKIYFVENNTTGDYKLLLQPSGGTAVTVVESGNNMIVATSGTTFSKMLGFIPDSIQSDVSINGNLAITSSVSVDGNITVAGNVSAASFDGDGTNVSNVTPKDNSVSTIKIVNNAVTTDKINNDAVTTAKLAHVNSNTGTKGGGTKSVSLTTNAEGQVTAVSETGIGWEYLGGISGSGSFSSTFVTTGNAYRTIKILFDFQAGSERTYTVQAAATSSYRTLISYTGDVDGTEVNGSLVIHNFNNAESPTFKIADANYRTYRNDDDGDFGGSSTFRKEGPIIYSYNEVWDNIRVTGTGSSSYKAYAFGMR